MSSYGEFHISPPSAHCRNKVQSWLWLWTFIGVLFACCSLTVGQQYREQERDKTLCILNFSKERFHGSGAGFSKLD